MKYLIIIYLALFGNICHASTDEFEQYLFRNNFSEDINDNYSFYRIFGISNEMSNMPTAFKNLDTNQYKNKNLGYIFNNLSNKYKFLKVKVFNGTPGLDQYDTTYRTHFVFSFKFNDSLSLSVVGMISRADRFYEESHLLSICRLFEINRFVLLPTLHNKKRRYQSLLDFIKQDNDPYLKEQLDELLRDFPEVAK